MPAATHTRSHGSRRERRLPETGTLVLLAARREHLKNLIRRFSPAPDPRSSLLVPEMSIVPVRRPNSSTTGTANSHCSAKTARASPKRADSLTEITGYVINSPTSVDGSESSNRQVGMTPINRSLESVT